jgi:putative MATE family efflux protein
MSENILLSEKIPKLYMKFVIPAVIAMVLEGIQGIVDGIFLGNFVGVNSMASVNIASAYLQIIIGSSMVICTGAMSSIGRALGKGDSKAAKDIFKSAIIALGIISSVILVVGFFFSDEIASFLGANDVLFLDTSRYIKTIALFVPIISFKILFGFIGRLIGKPQLYLAGTITCLISNIVFNFLAIKVLNLGVVGAAAATGIAYLLGMMVVIQPVISKRAILNIYDGKFCWDELKSLAFNGSSEGVTYVANALTLFLLNKSFMNFAGESGVAAFTIINYIGNFVILIMFGISDGISPIISSNYGAERIDRIEKTLYIGITANLTIGIGLFLIFNLFGKYLINIFINDNKEVIDMAVSGAKIYGFCFLFSGFNIIQSSYHTALGNAIASIMISLSRGIVFIAIGLVIFSIFWGIHGVWIALPFAEIITFILCILILYNRKKQEGYHIEEIK